MTDPADKASADATMDAMSDDPVAPEPTQAEIDAWVEREKRRRQAWLNGPTTEERDDYARRLRQRRLSDAFDEGESRIQDGVRMGVRYGRDTQLAAEGAMTLLYRWSRRTFGDLVRAGREWEEETSLPNRRRRVSLDDEDS
ncbi:MAG TPA: hypothetical protein VIL81_04295 [Candidatus Limnocylindrales bacterium]|jgi:hypothetical protein